MRYYIKTTNVETKESMVHPTPTFTSKKKAQAWATEFEKSMQGKAKAEVVK